MASPPFLERAQITGLVLAGGRGMRMGGLDKGLQPLLGRPMAHHALLRLAPQVGALLVSANRNLERYRAMGATVVTDAGAGFDGPLAGLEAGLRAARTPWVVSVPCDAPLVANDLVERLARATLLQGARIAVARSPSGLHPTFALTATDLAPDLTDFLASGGRRVREWQQRAGMVEVDFDDADHAFDNVNTQQELEALTATLETARR